jgi:hypothetical protein
VEKNKNIIQIDETDISKLSGDEWLFLEYFN